MRKLSLLLFFMAATLPGLVRAEIEIDSSDVEFSSHVTTELDLMRQGKRGVVCQTLVDRLNHSQATTTIKPVTKDERTWHPNDRKGTRSHTVPVDTKLRGAARTIPISAVIYLHPSRIDPHLSLFKLGTFVHELAMAADLNSGTYSGDYRIEERRASFFKNAWRDSQGSSPVGVSDRVETIDYQEAKKLGLLISENSSFFPILDPASFKPTPTP